MAAGWRRQEATATSAGAVVGFDTSSVTALTQKDAIGSVNLGGPEPLAKPLGE